jgi:tRNA threonylcarbamoyl adenosine modification protein YeaZ
MYKAEDKLILALETGLDGGSVALLNNDKQVDFLIGKENISKSEDLLILVEGLLDRNFIPKRAIRFIAVSDSPGSLTGLRIGLAIAKGLADSISAKICRISIFEALALLAGAKGKIISAVGNKNGAIFFREFGGKTGFRSIVESGSENKLTLIEFIEKLNGLLGQDFSLVINQELGRTLMNHANGRFTEKKKSKVYMVNGSYAEILGRTVALKEFCDSKKRL